jgi:hypothetical protein
MGLFASRPIVDLRTNEDGVRINWPEVKGMTVAAAKTRIRSTLPRPNYYNILLLSSGHGMREESPLDVNPGRVVLLFNTEFGPDHKIVNICRQGPCVCGRCDSLRMIAVAAFQE